MNGCEYEFGATTLRCVECPHYYDCEEYFEESEAAYYEELSNCDFDDE